MKTFINVLYRRILYKIPLKLLLILLAVVSVFIACFSHAVTLNNTDTDLFGFTHEYLNGTRNLREYYNDPSGVVCAFIEGGGGTFNDGTTTYNMSSYQTYCTDNDTAIITTNNTYIYYFFAVSDNFLNEFNPKYTSLECQTEYSLIPISSVDQSYCVENNLCPASGGGDCPNVGVSNVFINDIFHPGAFNIIINIPEEIDRDYAYTNSGSNINIDIVGYNVDYTKVQDQIDIQNFKPSKEDLSSIITQVVPLFIPGLAIILLLYFIFRFIKKVF